MQVTMMRLQLRSVEDQLQQAREQAARSREEAAVMARVAVRALSGRLSRLARSLFPIFLRAGRPQPAGGGGHGARGGACA